MLNFTTFTGLIINYLTRAILVAGMWLLSWGCGGSVGDVVAQLGMLWLSWGCGGSVGDVVAQLGMWWLSCRGCGGSVGDVVAQSGMWWLSWRCGGSVADVVAQLGMWWLSWGCGGLVAGDVVAQLAKATGWTRLQDSSSRFDPSFLHSVLRGGRNNDCVLKSNIRMWGVHSCVKKT
jgi:hypothetical protein